MAKKSIIARDKKRESVISKYESVRNSIIKGSKDITLSLEKRMEFSNKLQSLPRNSSSSRLVKRCQQCGRPHGVYRRFALCRICLRNTLMIGEVPGGRKSSW
jgi:small subunit ribosomal protein S14